MERDLGSAIRDALSVLSILPNMPADKATVAKAWMLVAQEDGLKPEDVARATRTLIRSRFFPTPGEFAEAARPTQTYRVWTPPALPAPVDPEAMEAVRARFDELREKMHLGPRETDREREERVKRLIEEARREA